MIDFVGIGAQKSATSWLFQCLREHPSVCLAEEKEVHYFSDDALYAKGSEWYEAHWKNCLDGKLKGEISTSYLSSPLAPERIKSYARDVKIIALLRDPVDRAESHIRHLLSKKELPEGASLNDMLRLRPDIFENGRYATHLAKYQELFPKEQIYIDTYNAISNDPLGVILRVDAFLGIAPHTPKALSLRYNSSAFRATALHENANKVHAFLSSVPGGRLLIRLIKSLGFSSAKLADAGHRAAEKTENLYRLSDADRATLTERYQSEIALLKEQGITFSN